MLWCPIVILTCLITGEVEPLLICFFWYLDILCGLLLWGYLLFLLLYRSSFVTWVWVLWYMYCKYLLFSFPFHSYWRIMINSGSTLIYSKLSFWGEEIIANIYVLLKNLCLPQCYEDILWCFLLESLVLSFALSSAVHLALILVYSVR